MVTRPPGETAVLGGTQGIGQSEIVVYRASVEVVFLCSLLWEVKNQVGAGF
jgi:hypothetical protein